MTVKPYAFDHRRPTVLVVDDEAADLVVLGDLLATDYQVRVARSGERALEMMHCGTRPDIILLDIMMPGLDGWAVLERLQADEAIRDIPVIFLTAKDTAADELRGLQRGAVDYITKPFNPAIVLARVHTQLELKAMRDYLAGENERLDAEVERRLRENTFIQDVSIRALANLAEIRDMETGNHILRTQTYVELLAHHLAQHPRFQDALAGPRLGLLVKAAPLHDMGKVGIPDAVLLKPGRLDEAEFEIMKTHAAVGGAAIGKAMGDAIAATHYTETEDIAGALGFMRVAQEIAQTHHERWDGTGYPAGLAGEAIPVSGRLMALADVYDALTCQRVYKAAFTLADVARDIIDRRGKQFDPDVVDAFIALRERFEQIAIDFCDASDQRSEPDASGSLLPPG